MIGSLLVAVCEIENGTRSTLCTSIAVTTTITDRGNSFANGIEGREFLGCPALLEDFTGFGISLQGQDGDFVDGIERLDVVGGGESSDSKHPIDILTFSDVWFTNRKLIGSKSSSFI